jgi:hypothetical protein
VIAVEEGEFWTGMKVPSVETGGVHLFNAELPVIDLRAGGDPDRPNIRRISMTLSWMSPTIGKVQIIIF